MGSDNNNTTDTTAPPLRDLERLAVADIERMAAAAAPPADDLTAEQRAWLAGRDAEKCDGAAVDAAAWLAGRETRDGVVARVIDAPAAPPATPPAPPPESRWLDGLVGRPKTPELIARLVDAPHGLAAEMHGLVDAPEAEGAAPPEASEDAAVDEEPPPLLSVTLFYAVVRIVAWGLSECLAAFAGALKRHPKVKSAPPAVAAEPPPPPSSAPSTPTTPPPPLPDDEAAAAAAVRACLRSEKPRASWGGAWGGGGVFRPLVDFETPRAPGDVFAELWEDEAFFKAFLEAGGDASVEGEPWAPSGTSRSRHFQLRHPLGIPVPRWVGSDVTVPTVKNQRAFANFEGTPFAVYEASHFTGIPYGETLFVETVCRVDPRGGGSRVRVAFRVVLSDAFPTWLSGIIVYKTEAELAGVYGGWRALAEAALRGRGAAAAAPPPPEAGETAAREVDVSLSDDASLALALALADDDDDAAAEPWSPSWTDAEGSPTRREAAAESWFPSWTTPPSPTRDVELSADAPLPRSQSEPKLLFYVCSADLLADGAPTVPLLKGCDDEAADDAATLPGGDDEEIPLTEE